MSPALAQLLVQLIGMLISEAPQLIGDVEKMIASAKGGGVTSDAGWQPIAPQVEKEMASEEAALQQPIPKK